MDSGHSNEARWPNNTLLTYTLPRTVKVRESVDVGHKKIFRDIWQAHFPRVDFVATTYVTQIGRAHV